MNTMLDMVGLALSGDNSSHAIVDEDDRTAFEILNSLEYQEERETVNLTRLFDSLFIAYTGDENILNDVRIELESDYDGLRLGDMFEQNDFEKMFDLFKKGQHLHAIYANKIIDKTICLLRDLPNIQTIRLKNVLRKYSSSSTSSNISGSGTKNDQYRDGYEYCIVVGDLHGHFDDLVDILTRFNIHDNLYYFVFNGDWVDRGNKQIEVLLTIFYAFILYPHRICLNRGNHEDHMQNSLNTYRPCFRMQAHQYFGRQYGQAIYLKVDKLFNYVPLATIIENKPQLQNIFVVHGGINDKLIIDEIQRLNRSLYTCICKKPDSLQKPQNHLELAYFPHIQDMLWSDPSDSPNEIQFNKNRNIGKLYGKNITKSFLQRNNFNLIIRSHECKANGYEKTHDDKLITIFSASHYNQSNQGAILVLSTQKSKPTILVYSNKPAKQPIVKETLMQPLISSLFSNDMQQDNDDDDNLTQAIRQLRMQMYKLKPMLLTDFYRYDTNHDGYVTIDCLLDILQAHLPQVPFEKIKDRICECDDNENRAKYESLFAFIHVKTRYESVPDYIKQNYELLQSVFNKIDKDSSGYITFNEFKDACEIILDELNVKFTTSEINQFMCAIDTNHDGFIDLQEFNTAFSVTFTK